MTLWVPPVILVVIVGTVLILAHRPTSQFMFRWLPLPLWCYALPMIVRQLGGLPASHPSYAWIIGAFLPIVLALLLLGMDWRAVARVGPNAAAAMTIGAAGIVVGGPLMFAVFRSWLPPQAWTGIGALAATWTGGSLNMIAMRSVVGVPDEIFASLIVVDALIAYSWMAVLVALSATAPRLDRWLRAASSRTRMHEVPASPRNAAPRRHRTAVAISVGLAGALAWACRAVSPLLPIGTLVASASGWTVLLVTTCALGLAAVPAVRSMATHGNDLGYAGLYVILSALGAQANLAALAAAPVWVLVGIGTVAIHAVFLLLAGKWLRVPCALLATASQANVGGVVSAPLVAAVYDQELAPVGLLLAVAGNAVGTYLGIASALLCRWLR